MKFDDNIVESTSNLLYELGSFLETSSIFDRYNINNLVDEIEEPCVLAVTGQVKAGKSYLINCLLGSDLAITGITETTATINIFKKGTPLYADKPVLCIWLDGSKEWMPRSFLDKLQGTSAEALNLASQIDRLIFYVDNIPFLDYVTIVDTPGIGAVVGRDGEEHQIQTEAYFRLRERHRTDTISLSNNADAIIYLFGNDVPTDLDKNFLASLYNNGNGLTSFNSIGVLPKCDKRKDIEQIKNYSIKYSEDFKRELFSIIPVSAALHRLIPSKETIKLVRDFFHLNCQDSDSFYYLTSSSSAFLKENCPGCSASLKDRKEFLHKVLQIEHEDIGYLWSAFFLICHIIYEHNSDDDVINKITEISGIESLSELIQKHFFERSKLLRCTQVLNSIKQILLEIKYNCLYDISIMSENRELCLQDISQLPLNSKTILTKLIEENIPSSQCIVELKNALNSLIKKVDIISSKINFINEQYLAYSTFINNRNLFTTEQYDELCDLFSGKKMENNYSSRAQHWSFICSQTAEHSPQHIIAEMAKKIYIQLLADK